MHMKPANNLLPVKNIKWLGYLCLSVFFSSLILSIVIDRIDLMYRALYIVVPLLITSYILFNEKKIYIDTIYTEYISNCIKTRNIKLVLITFNVLYLVSILILIISKTRPIIYFILIVSLISIILIEIVSLDTSKKSTTFIVIIQNTLVSLNIIWGVTLKYPLYFAGADTVTHMTYIESIINQSHLTNEMGPYLYYPLYHLLHAMSIKLLGVPSYQSLFLISGIVFQIGIIFSYIIIKLITKDNEISLLSSLLAMSSQEYIYYGNYVVTRIVAGIIFSILIYIVLKKDKDIRYRYLYLFITLVLVLYHHVTLIFVLLILFAMYFLEVISNKINKSKLLLSNDLLIPLVIFLFYSFYIAISFTESALIMTFKSALVSEIILGVPSSTNVRVFLMEHLNQSIFLLFYSLGFLYILRNSFQPTEIKKFTLLALISLPVYIPTPITSFTFFNELLRFDRISMLVTPFMMMIMAYGILYIKNSYKKKIVFFIVILLISIYSFASILNTANSPDYPVFQNKEDIPNRYFTEGELNGISFLQKECKYNLYSDYFVYRLLGEKPKILMINGDMFNNPHQGYLLIRNKEWSLRTLLLLEEDNYPLRPVKYKKNIESDHNLQRNYYQIYNNIDTIIYYKG